MPEYQRFTHSQSDEVTVVCFHDSKILDFNVVNRIGDELSQLVEQENCKLLLINLRNVEFLSSAALNKIIVLDKRLKSLGGGIALAEAQPQVLEVFSITGLTRLFPIYESEADALSEFKSASSS